MNIFKRYKTGGFEEQAIKAVEDPTHQNRWYDDLMAFAQPGDTFTHCDVTMVVIGHKKHHTIESVFKRHLVCWSGPAMLCHYRATDGKIHDFIVRWDMLRALRKQNPEVTEK